MFSKYRDFMKEYISLNTTDWNIIKSKLKIENVRNETSKICMKKYIYIYANFWCVKNGTLR